MLKRKRVPELMDDPNLDPALHQAALRGLERLNRLSNSAGALARPIVRLIEKAHLKVGGSADEQTIRVLDVACGAGDLPIQLYANLKKRGLNVTVHGLDISPTAIAYAGAKNAQAGTGCTFGLHDIFKDALPSGYDVITTSLFTHHLDPPEIKMLLTKMSEKAEKMILVNDLERSLTSLVSVTLATRLVTTSAVVHFDGPASVHAAFTGDEMLTMAVDAGLKNAKIQKHWPCRIVLEWQKR